MTRMKATILQILKPSPFFKRFTDDVLVKYLSGGKVENFERDSVVFLKGRVGVITHGSVRLTSHE